MTTLEFIGTLTVYGIILVGFFVFFHKLINEWWECEGRFRKKG